MEKQEYQKHYFRLPISDAEYFEKFALIKKSELMSEKNLKDLDFYFQNKANPDHRTLAQTTKDALIKASSISDYEYAILYSLQEINDLIKRRDPQILILVRDSTKYFEKVLTGENRSADEHLNLEHGPEFLDEIDVPAFRSLSSASTKYANFFVERIKARLACLEVLGSIFSKEFLPLLIETVFNTCLIRLLFQLSNIAERYYFRIKKIKKPNIFWKRLAKF